MTYFFLFQRLNMIDLYIFMFFLYEKIFISAYLVSIKGESFGTVQAGYPLIQGQVHWLVVEDLTVWCYMSLVF